ncbi:MAG: hypothetical protein KJP18_04325, partial [Gemmatimonadetes bacterium]|nr:hypothetical protein [Gemmatimonadota bacterium]
MTRDEFEARYRLLQTALRSGGVITHHALSPEGAVVMVHVFDGEPGAVGELHLRAEQLEAAGDSRILERLQVDDHPVLVTRFILDFEGLDVWLPPAASAPPVETGGADPVPSDPSPGPAAPASSPPPASPAAGGGGEFTRFFSSADVPDVPDVPEGSDGGPSAPEVEP